MCLHCVCVCVLIEKVTKQFMDINTRYYNIIPSIIPLPHFYGYKNMPAHFNATQISGLYTQLKRFSIIGEKRWEFLKFISRIIPPLILIRILWIYLILNEYPFIKEIVLLKDSQSYLWIPLFLIFMVTFASTSNTYFFALDTLLMI